MNSNLISTPSINIQQSMQRQTTPLVQLIVFSVENLNLALPIESVYKVFNQAPIYGSGIRSVGVTHVEDREITVVDLYRRFFQTNPMGEAQEKSYLILVQNTRRELYGIPVADTPVLMEVPLSAIRVLPESYRRADTIDLASHVAIIPQASASLTVFVLDVDLLLPSVQETVV